MKRRTYRPPPKSDRFVAHCNACPEGSLKDADGQVCQVVVIRRHGRKELGICRGCACAHGKCDACGQTGEHWLGCSLVGIPEDPNPEGGMPH